MATLLLRQVSIHHKFLTPSPIQVAPSTAGAQVPHLSPTLQPPINISSNIIIVITTFSRFIIATTALYGELGRGNVSSAFQSPAAIPCTPPPLFAVLDTHWD
jgi:hypothetical protein